MPRRCAVRRTITGSAAVPPPSRTSGAYAALRNRKWAGGGHLLPRSNDTSGRRRRLRCTFSGGRGACRYVIPCREPPRLDGPPAKPTAGGPTPARRRGSVVQEEAAADAAASAATDQAASPETTPDAEQAAPEPPPEFRHVTEVGAPSFRHVTNPCGPLPPPQQRPRSRAADVPRTPAVGSSGGSSPGSVPHRTAGPAHHTKRTAARSRSSSSHSSAGRYRPPHEECRRRAPLALLLAIDDEHQEHEHDQEHGASGHTSCITAGWQSGDTASCALLAPVTTDSEIERTGPSNGVLRVAPGGVCRG